jgi:hypothetical protein
MSIYIVWRFVFKKYIRKKKKKKEKREEKELKDVD